MTLLRELMAYDPTDYGKRYRIFSQVGVEPRNLGLIADRACVTTGDAINHMVQMEEDGLVVCHSEPHQEWRLADV